MDKVKQIYLGDSSLITALGDKNQTLSAMADYKSGLSYNSEYDMIVGSIDKLHSLAQIHPSCSFFESLIINNIKAVVEQSKVDLSDDRSLVIIATTKGNVQDLEKSVDPVPESTFLGNSAQKIQNIMGLKHCPIVISNACISGLSAMIVGRDLILNGNYDHVIVVGCDVLSRFITEGFASFKSISSQPCRPYDKDRDGLSLGEACGAILITCDESKSSKPCIYFNGGAITNDANHISGPSRTGDGLFTAVDRAMKEAGIEKDSLAFINAHGTSTIYNDEMESKAFALANMGDLPLNSFKPYIGHTLGACGVVETILCIGELASKTVFGTLGYRQSGTSFCLGVDAKHQSVSNTSFLKTGSGFGGCNAAIIISQNPTKIGLPNYNVVDQGSYTLAKSESYFHDFIRSEYKMLSETGIKFFKMSDLCKAAYVAATNLLQDGLLEKYNPEDIAIILANKSSSLEADIEHQKILNKNLDEGASPAIFVYTLPNVVSGELCIRHKIKGNNTFFVENTQSSISSDYAHILIKTGKAKLAIWGWCEKLGEDWDIRLNISKLIN